MKKNFKFYLVIWASLFILFNAVTFIWQGRSGRFDLDAPFWIGYIIIILSFVGQFGASYYALKDDNLTKTFYKLPVLKASYIGLAVCFAAAIITSFIALWIGAIICILAVGLNAFAVLRAVVAVETVAAVDEKIKTQTFFIKSMTVDSETVMNFAKTEQSKEACRQVYEAFRYSDKMSSPELSDEENEIKAEFAVLSGAVKDGSDEEVKASSEKLLVLIKARNSKCKLLK